MRARVPRLPRHGCDRRRREAAMALHRAVRGPRTLGRKRRSDAESLDRGLGALSGAGAGMIDPAAARRATEAVPGIPCNAEGPVFREPWEAQTFAMALALHERGLFTWHGWAATLGEEIKRAPAAGDQDTGQ